MPYYTYIIRSDKTGNYYFGHCQNLSERLFRHNSAKVKSTKGRRPWSLYYHEEFESKSEAYLREQFFKSFEGRKWLYENRILEKKIDFE